MYPQDQARNVHRSTKNAKEEYDMKIVTYEVENKTKLGIFSADGQWVYPLECFGIEYQEMQEAIAEMSDSEIQLLNHMSKKDPYETPGAARIEEMKILAPILRPKLKTSRDKEANQGEYEREHHAGVQKPRITSFIITLSKQREKRGK